MNSSSFSLARTGRAERVPNYFTTAVPRSYFSIGLSLNLSMTSEYQLAGKNKNHKHSPLTTPHGCSFPRPCSLPTLTQGFGRHQLHLESQPQKQISSAGNGYI